MGDDGPAWYYVDGQLRYRDRDGWTDPFQTIDRAYGSNVTAVDKPDVLGPATRAEARKPHDRSSRGTKYPVRPRRGKRLLKGSNQRAEENAAGSTL